VWIYQNAWFHLGKFEKGITSEYKFKASGSGVYSFILSGEVTIEDLNLKARDGLGIWDTDKISISAVSDAEFLLMEVPMK
jgi:redox-sensitive bicupin YhaK (pirin superfamily)